MVASKEQNKTDPKDGKIITLTNHLSKLKEKNTSVLVTFQRGGGNTTQTHTNNIVKETKNSYVEGLNNLESWRVNKSKDDITRDGQY